MLVNPASAFFGGSSLGQFIKRLIQDDRGQATTEYILILSASVVAAVSLSRGILNVLDRGIKSLGAQLENDLKTGRAPTSVWKN